MSSGENPDRRKGGELVGFRVSKEFKQLLEDIARASGYDTVQDFMFDVALGVESNVPPRIMKLVAELQQNRKHKVSPEVSFPKEHTERQGT